MKNIGRLLSISNSRIVTPAIQKGRCIQHVPGVSTASLSIALSDHNRRNLGYNTQTNSSRKQVFPPSNRTNHVKTAVTARNGNTFINGTNLTMLRTYATQVNIDDTSEMDDLAHSYSASGDHKKAVELRRQILEMKKKSLGEDHPSIFLEMFFLARSLSDQGSAAAYDDHQEALTLRTEVVKAVRNEFGDVHSYLVAPMNELAASYATLGQSQEELKIREEVVDIQTKLHGEDHIDTLAALDDLSYAYCKVADVNQDIQHCAKALELARNVVDKKTKILIEQSPETILSEERFITLLLSLRNVSIGLLAKSTAKMSQIGSSASSNHGQESNAEMNAKVLEVGKKLLPIVERTWGQNHEETINTMSHLAVAYNEIGEHQEAVVVYRKLLDACKSTLGDDNSLTLQTMNNLGYTLDKLGDMKGSLELQKEVVELTKRVLGEDHPHTIRSMTNLGAVTYKAATSEFDIPGIDKEQGIEEARRLYNQAYEAFERLYGNDKTGKHPEMVDLKRYIDEFNQVHPIV